MDYIATIAYLLNKYLYVKYIINIEINGNEKRDYYSAVLKVKGG